jgi:hypothetical protein
MVGLNAQKLYDTSAELSSGGVDDAKLAATGSAPKTDVGGNPVWGWSQGHWEDVLEAMPITRAQASAEKCLGMMLL